MATVTFTSNNYSSGTCLFSPTDPNYAVTDLGSITFPFIFDPGQYGLPNNIIEGSFVFTTAGCEFTKTVVRPATNATNATVAPTSATSATTMATPTSATNATVPPTIATTVAWDSYIYLEMAKCSSAAKDVATHIGKFFKGGGGELSDANGRNLFMDNGLDIRLGFDTGWTLQSNGESGYPEIDGGGCFYATAIIDANRYAAHLGDANANWIEMSRAYSQDWQGGIEINTDPNEPAFGDNGDEYSPQGFLLSKEITCEDCRDAEATEATTLATAATTLATSATEATTSAGSSSGSGSGGGAGETAATTIAPIATTVETNATNATQAPVVTQATEATAATTINAATQATEAPTAYSITGANNIDEGDTQSYIFDGSTMAAGTTVHWELRNFGDTDTYVAFANDLVTERTGEGQTVDNGSGGSQLEIVIEVANDSSDETHFNEHFKLIVWDSPQAPTQFHAGEFTGEYAQKTISINDTSPTAATTLATSATVATTVETNATNATQPPAATEATEATEATTINEATEATEATTLATNETNATNATVAPTSATNATVPPTVETNATNATQPPAATNATEATEATTINEATEATEATTLATNATNATVAPTSATEATEATTLATNATTLATEGTTLATEQATNATEGTQATVPPTTKAEGEGGEGEQTPTIEPGTEATNATNATTLATNATNATTLATDATTSAPASNYEFRSCTSEEGGPGSGTSIFFEQAEFQSNYGIPDTIQPTTLQAKIDRSCYEYVGLSGQEANARATDYGLNGCNCSEALGEEEGGGGDRGEGEY